MSLLLLGIMNSQAAGGAQASFELLQTIDVTNDTPSVNFTNVTQHSTDYKHLQIRASLQSSAGGDLRMRFNDLTSGYSNQRIEDNTTSQDNNTNAFFLGRVPMFNQGANNFSSAELDIFEAFDNIHKSIQGFHGAFGIGVDGFGFRAGRLENTAAISKISFFMANGGNLKEDSNFSLYGIRA